MSSESTTRWHGQVPLLRSRPPVIRGLWRRDRILGLNEVQCVLKVVELHSKLRWSSRCSSCLVYKGHRRIRTDLYFSILLNINLLMLGSILGESLVGYVRTWLCVFQFIHGGIYPLLRTMNTAHTLLVWSWSLQGAHTDVASAKRRVILLIGGRPQRLEWLCWLLPSLTWLVGWCCLRALVYSHIGSSSTSFMEEPCSDWRFQLVLQLRLAFGLGIVWFRLAPIVTPYRRGQYCIVLFCLLFLRNHLAWCLIRRLIGCGSRSDVRRMLWWYWCFSERLVDWSLQLVEVATWLHPIVVRHGCHPKGGNLLQWVAAGQLEFTLWASICFEVGSSGGIDALSRGLHQVAHHLDSFTLRRIMVQEWSADFRSKQVVLGHSEVRLPILVHLRCWRLAPFYDLGVVLLRDFNSLFPLNDLQLTSRSTTNLFFGILYLL